MLAGLPPIFGLYAAFVPLLVYTVMGSSRHVQIGPEALMALLVGSFVSQSAPIDVRVVQAGTLAVFAGAFTLGAGLLRFGYVESILSKVSRARGVRKRCCCALLKEGKGEGGGVCADRVINAWLDLPATFTPPLSPFSRRLGI